VVDLPRDVVQQVRRTRRQAEAALARAEQTTFAFRAELAELPAEMRVQPAFRKLLARLDHLDVQRALALELLAAGREFEG
jgi:hypothetical protein